MTTFLRRTAFFCALCLLVVTGLFVAVRHMVNAPGNFRLPPDRHIMVLGHSHAANTFVDSLMPGLLNMASPTEGYFYSFAKTRKLVESNPQIRTVLIDVHNNQLSEYANDRIFGHYADHLLRKYFSQLTPGELFYLLRKTPRVTLVNFPLSIRTGVTFALSGNRSYPDFADWGGYIALDHVISADKLDSARRQAASRKGLISRNYNLSEKNLWSLAGLVQYLQQKRIQVLFFRSPTIQFAPPTPSDCVLHDVLQNEFEGIPFLDLQNFPLERTDFADLSHMNVSGAEKVSAFMRRQIADGLLDCDDPELRLRGALEALNHGDLATSSPDIRTGRRLNAGSINQ